nr:hypothetical protein BaRGS_030354 [Batillaria attramentaria]
MSAAYKAGKIANNPFQGGAPPAGGAMIPPPAAMGAPGAKVPVRPPGGPMMGPGPGMPLMGPPGPMGGPPMMPGGMRPVNFDVNSHNRYGGGSLMVWDGISVQGKTDLHVFWNGTLTAIRYRDEILDPVLGQALQQEWDQIPQQTIRSLICSMRRRCQAVISARGGHTRY